MNKLNTYLVTVKKGVQIDRMHGQGKTAEEAGKSVLERWYYDGGWHVKEVELVDE